MNNRERVIASLEHRQPDKTPYHLNWTIPAREKIIAFTGDPDFPGKIDNCLTHLNPHQGYEYVEVRPDIWRDGFGVEWNRTVDKDIGVVCNQLVTPETVDDYEFPDPNDPVRFKGYQTARADFPGQFIVPNLGFSLFERAWTLAGMENVLMGMVANPKWVNRLLDRVLEFNLQVIENACSFDVDAMMFGDDWGQQTGLIMGPDLWREFILPRVRTMYQAVKAKGKFVFIHSCGKVQSVFPDLIEAGLDCFNPFQPEVNNPFDMKREFGDRLSFYGGVSTQQTLPFGTPEQTRDEVKKLLDIVGKDGGYICAPAHDIPGDAKPENILAMLEVLQAQ